MRCHICDTDTDALYLNPTTNRYEPCGTCIDAINSAHLEAGMVDLELPTDGAPLNANLLQTPNESVTKYAKELNELEIDTDI